MRNREEAISDLARRCECSPEAFVLVFEVIDYAVQKRGGPKRHLSCNELAYGLQAFALETFGLFADHILGLAGIETSEDFGWYVFKMVEDDLLQKTADDRLEEFDGLLRYDAPAFAPLYADLIASIEL